MAMVNIPAQYASDVQWASSYTGLPQSVVGAQINEESGFDPTAVSPTGAQGIAQFEPGTWATWGRGSPFNAQDAFQAYAKFMKYLLNWAGGNMQKALAAYNAGQGNWTAGLGYANTILSNAGASGKAAPGTGTGQPPGNNSLTSIPGNVANSIFSGIGTSILNSFGVPNFKDMAIRAGLIILGALMLIVGIVVFAGREAGTTALTIAAPESAAAQVASGATARAARKRTQDAANS